MSERRTDHSARDVLRELFPESYRELFGEGGGAEGGPLTLGLYPVADGRLALVHGDQLAEFTPLDPKSNKALHCDLCHYTRSRSEATLFRVVVGARRTRYVTLCLGTEACQKRAGRRGLETLADRIFPLEPVHAD
ncbi:hypothetical protein [Deinococcus budaensis]|uniref:Elongation factor G-binding protein C-terminal treble-clef zinc-finger domain-containing protein n=1 Tax=Deinococcus budaensis TaxID=1665626 RepID=A0A7W8GC42_9DEIO|nr:hypothetical protein [Deinococcus budaensis]MBB5232606.1 hypothetical protein [Deinococcus budaensis]